MTSCDFIAGWIGGCAGIIVGHPLDTLKVRQQFGGKSNLWKTGIKTLSGEGVSGLFKGLFYPVISSGAINSIFFGVYGVTLNFFQKCDDQRPSYSAIFWSGCVGGTVQLAIACPVELIKVKLQSQMAGPAKFRGPWHCTRHTLQHQGVSGLYRGLVPHAWRDGPGFGAYMLLYEMSLSALGGRETSGASQQFLAGGFAGVMCWLSVLPFDVIKSRMQADDLDRPRYKNMLDCARQSYAEGGWRLFTRGWFAMSLRAFPVNAVTFLVYELLLDSCNRVNHVNKHYSTYNS